MNSFSTSRQLAAAGRFTEALEALERGRFTSAERVTADVLRAELLERVGRYDQSRSQLSVLLKSKSLSTLDRSTCEFVFGRLEWELGHIESSILHLQRSSSLASRAGHSERACWSQLRLLLILADESGPDAIAPLQPPFPTACNFPFHPDSGSHTSMLIPESVDGVSVAATRQEPGGWRPCG